MADRLQQCAAWSGNPAYAFYKIESEGKRASRIVRPQTVHEFKTLRIVGRDAAARSSPDPHPCPGSPDILLLDEPFSALDYQTRLSVGDDIGQIIRNAHKTALLVTHDLSEAVSLADRVIILTKRPATIAKIVPITFTLEKDTPLLRRNAPEFKNYFNIIWEELNKNE